MVVCPKCGCANLDSVYFCRNCGSRLPTILPIVKTKMMSIGHILTMDLVIRLFLFFKMIFFNNNFNYFLIFFNYLF